MADEFQPYDVSIPYPGLADQFEEWVRSKGWTLSPIVNIEGSDRPMRFVQPTFGEPPVPKQVDPVTYPCPHGCTDHRVKSLDPTACGHYHSPSEWGHHEQKHNSDYWKAISEQSAPTNPDLLTPKTQRNQK
jgi:hypothetical protein